MSQEPDAPPPIDGTDEARAIAAAARSAAKRKCAEVGKAEQVKPRSKKLKAVAPRISTSTHTVAVPDGYEPDTQRDTAVFGEFTGHVTPASITIGVSPSKYSLAKYMTFQAPRAPV